MIRNGATRAFFVTQRGAAGFRDAFGIDVRLADVTARAGDDARPSVTAP